MSDPIVPDDLARSKSGRVPQWVLDEARGIKTEPVPFRAAPSTSTPKAPREGRGWKGLRILLTLAILGGLVAIGITTGAGGDSLLGGSQSSQAHRTQPPNGHEESKHPLGKPAPVDGTSSSFRFEQLQDDEKTPVTWSPCRPIHYVVRPDNAPANGMQMIQDAVARLHAATGLKLVYDGTTDEGPRTDRRPYQKDRYGDRWAPVLIVWPTLDEVPDFGVDILGEAGAQAVRSDSGDLVYVTGIVSLDPIGLTRYTNRYSEASARAVVLHELGHLVGLAHVNDKGQIMYPQANTHVTEYQAGDLTGLSKLATGPCQKDV